MKRRGRIVISSLLAAVLVMSVARASAEESADGWYSWQIDGEFGAASSCCYRYDRGDLRKGMCELDGGKGSIVTGDTCSQLDDNKILFVRKQDGLPVRLAVFDASCSVRTRSPVTDLGTVSSDEAVLMLLDFVKRSDLNRKTRESALFWLAQSGSDRAFQYLDELIAGG